MNLLAGTPLSSFGRSFALIPSGGGCGLHTGRVAYGLLQNSDTSVHFRHYPGYHGGGNFFGGGGGGLGGGGYHNRGGFLSGLGDTGFSRGAGQVYGGLRDGVTAPFSVIGGVGNVLLSPFRAAFNLASGSHYDTGFGRGLNQIYNGVQTEIASPFRVLGGVTDMAFSPFRAAFNFTSAGTSPSFGGSPFAMRPSFDIGRAGYSSTYQGPGPGGNIPVQVPGMPVI